MNSQYLIIGDAENREVEQLAGDHPVSMEQPEYKLRMLVLEFAVIIATNPTTTIWKSKWLELQILRVSNVYIKLGLTM